MGTDWAAREFPAPVVRRPSNTSSSSRSSNTCRQFLEYAFRKADVLDQPVTVQIHTSEPRHYVQVGFELKLWIEGVKDRDQRDFGLAALTGQINYDTAQGKKIRKKLLPVRRRISQYRAGIARIRPRYGCRVGG
jgi:hypothetical protein